MGNLCQGYRKTDATQSTAQTQDIVDVSLLLNQSSASKQSKQKYKSILNSSKSNQELYLSHHSDDNQLQQSANTQEAQQRPTKLTWLQVIQQRRKANDNIICQICKIREAQGYCIACFMQRYCRICFIKNHKQLQHQLINYRNMEKIDYSKIHK